METTRTNRNDGRTDKRTIANGRTVGCHDCGTPVDALFAASIGERYPDIQYYCVDHEPLVSEVA